MYNIVSDMMLSLLAFLGLASMVFCYWDGSTTKMDYFLFSVIFFIFGVYTNYVFRQEYQYFYLLGGVFYAIGVIITLILNKKYRDWRAKK